MSGAEATTAVWMSEPDRAPTMKSRGMKKLAGMDLEELRRVADVPTRRPPRPGRVFRRRAHPPGTCRRSGASGARRRRCFK